MNSELKYNVNNTGISAERLVLKKDKLNGDFNVFTGKTGDIWLSIIPSLKVSGYGDSPENSLKDLKYNLDVFSHDLFAASLDEVIKELKSLGWKSKPLFPKKYSNSYIDEKGVLQNFDYPEKVERTTLEAA